MKIHGVEEALEMGVPGKEDKETRIGTLRDLEPEDGNWEQVKRPTPVRPEGPRKRQSAGVSPCAMLG